MNIFKATEPNTNDNRIKKLEEAMKQQTHINMLLLEQIRSIAKVMVDLKNIVEPK
jgi:hypothetical protein